jgi:amidase
VDWADPDFGRVGDQAATLYLRGIHEDFRKLPQPQRAMRCTRGLARLGSLYPGFAWRRAKRLRPKFAGRINRIFDDHDVLLTCVTGTHTHEIGRWEGQGGLRTIIGMSRTHPFNVVWNYTGNPAAAVPMGFAGDGMPLSVQIVGRPNDEATLLSLAAQIEAERPWADRRPPVS